MKIEIETPTEEEKEIVFAFFKRFCIENLQEFKLKVEDLEHNQERKDG